MNALAVQILPPQFFTNDGNPLDGGTLTILFAGTSTPATTYADADMNAANPNPLTLNAAGRADVFFDPVDGSTDGVAYDIEVRDASNVLLYTLEGWSVPVVATGGNLTDGVVGYGDASALSIGGGAITPTKNVHMLVPEGGAADDLDTIAITDMPDGAPLVLGNSNASAAVTVNDNVGNIQLAGNAPCVLTTVTDRLSLIRTGVDWVETARTVGGGVTSGLSGSPGGRLTLVSGNPVGQGSGSTLYYTPYVSDQIALYTGVIWQPMTFSETSIALPATTNTLYDVFGFDNSGTFALALVAWTNTTTRATAITRQNGVFVQAGTPTRRYLGTVGTGGSTGASNDTTQLRYLYNYYNRIARLLRRVESAGTWNYNLSAWRFANGNSANQILIVNGVSEETLSLSLIAYATATAYVFALNGIGENTASSPAAECIGMGMNAVAAEISTSNVALVKTPPIGRSAYTWLEQGIGSSETVTWYGNASTFISGMTGFFSM